MIVVLWWLGASIVLTLILSGLFSLKRYRRLHPCSNPGCASTAWWRVFFVLHDATGKMLARMPSPFRLCSACYRDLDPKTVKAAVERPTRRKIAKAFLHKYHHRIDWDRTKVDREHVFAAWARRLGGRR